MGFMDKLKQSATSAKDSMKKTFDETSAAMKARNEESKELKKPLDSAIERYEVTYVSGLPDIPKRKAGAIGLNIMPECFSFRATITTKEWFADYDIPYSKISELRIEKRTISTTEVFLGAGDSANQEQENVICILYTDGDGKKLTLRVEMLTGTTIFNQAAKCREFMDLLRQYEITDKFETKDKNESNSSSNGTDVLAQIEKLNQLKLAGILTEEEFSSKKADLLSKL
ncbi:MAG: SHOCT domain-containing protein [Ruminococcus sp.]